MEATNEHAQPLTNGGVSVQGHNRTRQYILIFAGMIGLTAIEFLAVGLKIAPRSILFPSILVLALIQVFMQVYLFMHLNSGRKAYSAFFGAGASLAILVILAIMFLVWIY